MASIRAGTSEMGLIGRYSNQAPRPAINRLHSPWLASLSGMNAVPEEVRSLPGADLIARGLADLEAGRETTEALLVSIGAPRLRSLGYEVSSPFGHPEHRLYLRLARDKGNAAHSSYNALIRRLISFERAAQCAT
jgi:hypothetical protein